MKNLTLSREYIVRLCERVEGAQKGAYAIPKLTDEYPDMTIADGYAVQSELRRRFIAQGHKLIGWKAGLTSKAKMIQMGVNVPSIGFLTDRMARPENSAIKTSDMVHPRVECEVAFVTKKTLKGPNCTRQDVLDATDYVLPAVEIIDSRFSSFSSICMAWRSFRSSADRGSYRSRTLGAGARARARATRCCWPPESWLTLRSAKASSFTSASISSVLDFTCAAGRPSICRPKATFCATVRCGNRA